MSNLSAEAEALFPPNPRNMSDYAQAFVWAESAVAHAEWHNPLLDDCQPDFLPHIVQEAQNRMNIVADRALAERERPLPDDVRLAERILWELPERLTEARIEKTILWAQARIRAAVRFAQSDNAFVTYRDAPRESRRWWMKTPLDGEANEIISLAERAYEAAALMVQGLNAERSAALQPIIDELHAELRRIEPIRAAMETPEH